MAVDAYVAVVGAGPVGLSAALLLARAGLGVVVLERSPGPVTESRATDLHARTLEALAPSGLAESLHPLGRRVDRVEMWSQGRRLGGFDLARLRSPYPYILTVPQIRATALRSRTRGEPSWTAVSPTARPGRHEDASWFVSWPASFGRSGKAGPSRPDQRSARHWPARPDQT